MKRTPSRVLEAAARGNAEEADVRRVLRVATSVGLAATSAAVREPPAMELEAACLLMCGLSISGQCALWDRPARARAMVQLLAVALRRAKAAPPPAPEPAEPAMIQQARVSRAYLGLASATCNTFCDVYCARPPAALLLAAEAIVRSDSLQCLSRLLATVRLGSDDPWNGPVAELYEGLFKTTIVLVESLLNCAQTGCGGRSGSGANVPGFIKLAPWGLKLCAALAHSLLPEYLIREAASAPHALGLSVAIRTCVTLGLVTGMPFWWALQQQFPHRPLPGPNVQFVLTAMVVEVLRSWDGGTWYGLPPDAEAALRRSVLGPPGTLSLTDATTRTTTVLLAWLQLMTHGSAALGSDGSVFSADAIYEVCMRMSACCMEAAMGGRPRSGNGGGGLRDRSTDSSSGGGFGGRRGSSGRGAGAVRPGPQPLQTPAARDATQVAPGQPLPCANRIERLFLAGLHALEGAQRVLVARQSKPRPSGGVAAPANVPVAPADALASAMPDEQAAKEPSGAAAAAWPRAAAAAAPVAEATPPPAPPLMQPPEGAAVLLARPQRWWAQAAWALGVASELTPGLEAEGLSSCGARQLATCMMSEGQLSGALPAILPPQPPPDVAAALAAGLLPALERLFRRTCSSPCRPGEPDRAALPLLDLHVTLLSFMWPQMAWLFAYGDPGQAEALVAAVGGALATGARAESALRTEGVSLPSLAAVVTSALAQGVSNWEESWLAVEAESSAAASGEGAFEGGTASDGSGGSGTSGGGGGDSSSTCGGRHVSGPAQQMLQLATLAITTFHSLSRSGCSTV